MKTCPVCGEQNQSFAAFCWSCGTPFGDPDAPPAAPPQPAAAAGGAPATSGARNWRLSLRPEVFVGLAILLAALLYAGYDWLHHVQAAADYHDGVVARQKHDWDSAAASFSRAGDYGDAQQLAKEALHSASERDRFYAAALTAQSHGDLWDALQALGQVSTIQPGYKDSTERTAQVRQAAYTVGLAGVVYLSNAPAQPGLYLIDEQGRHVYLPASDASSQLRASYSAASSQLQGAAEGTALVYDGPASSTGARQVVLARIDAAGAVSSIIVPQLDSRGSGVFTVSGFWWYNGSQNLSRQDTEAYFVDTTSTALRVTHLSDLPVGRRVLAVAPGAGKILLSENQPVRGGFSVGTQLYLANADGSASRDLGKAVGAVYQAALSYDGRWAIYVMQQGTAITARSVWSLALDGDSVKATSLDSMSSSADTATYLNAWLISHTYHDASVIILKYYNTIDELSIRDLESGQFSTKWSDSIVHRSGLSFSASGDFMLSRELEGDGQAIDLFSTSQPRPQPLRLNIPGPYGQLIDVQMAPYGDFIVVTADQPAADVSNVAGPVVTPQRNYSVRLNGSAGLAQAQELGNVSGAAVGGRNNVVLPAAGLLVAAINPQQQLQASFYDGSEAKVVAEDVAAVWILGNEGQ